MKFWVPILLLLIVLGIAILLRTRERFSSGAIDPVCSDGLVLVGEKCRGEGSISENGQCPDGTSMNEEGMCQRLEDPRCPPYYTMRVENGVAKCEPENAPVEPSDEEMMAQQEEGPSPSCPAGFTYENGTCKSLVETDTTNGVCPGMAPPNANGKCNTFVEPTCGSGFIFTNTFDRDTQKRSGMCVRSGVPPAARAIVKPTCPDGLVLVEDLGHCGTQWNANKLADATCPPNHEIKISYGVSRCEPVGSSSETTTTTTTTTGATTTETTEEGVTPATVRKNNVLGPVFTSYGSPVDGGDPNAWKSKQYPELLGGGDPAARQREQGAGGGFGFGLGSLTGAMPTAAGLGATEQSRFFPTSRQPGDMELIPDPYRVSQQFSSASYSFKTEPTPFLTDFSAFFR